MAGQQGLGLLRLPPCMAHEDTRKMLLLTPARRQNEVTTEEKDTKNSIYSKQYCAYCFSVSPSAAYCVRTKYHQIDDEEERIIR